MKRKAICFILGTLLLFGAMLPVSVRASESDGSKSRIIVALGDSYSSGEGLAPFMGANTEDPLSKKLSEEGWLAHRSRYDSWSGMLKLSAVSNTMADHYNVNWYFVAASGAKIKNLKNPQPKDVWRFDENRKKTCYSKELPPQLDVFKRLAEEGKKADYVVLTLSGNDVNFVPIIEKAAKTVSFFKPNELYEELHGLWEKWYAETREQLHQAYFDIQEAAGDQATIIVAGYPELLDERAAYPLLGAGYGALFNPDEVWQINHSVRGFNEELERLVNECREKDHLNIHFVSVEKAFENHKAYAKDEYVEKIHFIKPGTDESEIDIFTFFSSASLHPNREGARVYAACVQKKIDELESKKAEQSAAEADAKRADWSRAYRAFVQEKEYLSFPGVQFGSDEGCIQFALHDFERDGIPELLIGNGSDTHLNGGAYVFAYRDGQILCLGDIASDPGGLGLFSSDDGYYTGLFWTESFQGSRGTLYYYIDEKGQLARELVESGEFENRETFSGEYHLRSRTGDDALFALAREPYVIELVTYDRETIQRIGWDNFVAFYQRIWDSMMHWQTGEQHPGIPRGASAGKDPTPTPKKTPTPSPKKTPTPSPKKTPTPSPKKTPTPSPKKTPASAEEVWKRLYMDLIESGSYTQWLETNDTAFDGQWFALHDMDGDGTPELIFTDGGEWYQYYSHVCTIKNGSVRYVGRLRAPLGFPRGENGEQQFFYHYYENGVYPGLFVQTDIAWYYDQGYDHYVGYFRLTPDGQLKEEVVEATGSGKTTKRTGDDGLYRTVKNGTAIPLRFVEREDLLGGKWDRLWATLTGAAASTGSSSTGSDAKGSDPGDTDLWGAVDRSGILDNIYKTYAEIDAVTGELECVEVEYEIGLFHYIYCFKGSSIFYSFETDLSPVEYDTETGTLERSQVAPYIRPTDQCDGVCVSQLSQLGFNGKVNAKDFCDEFFADEGYEDLWVALTTHNGYRVEFLCDDSRGTISGNSPVWFKTEIVRTGAPAQTTETRTPDAAEGGFHGDKDGFGGFFADQDGYRIPLGFGDRYDSDEIFAVAKTWEIVSNTPDVEEYGFFDLDRDGPKELIMKIGTCEADYRYTFYRYDDYEGTFSWIGNVSGSHSMLYTDGSYLIRENAHMGSQTISRIEYAGGQLKETRLAHYDVSEGDYVDMGYEPVYMCTKNIYLDYVIR